MNNKEAIHKLIQFRRILEKGVFPVGYRFDAEPFDMAVEALEKQIPKKPRHIDKNATFDGNWKRVCPACGRVLVERITTSEASYPRLYNYTPHCICGQAINWEEES